MTVWFYIYIFFRKKYTNQDVEQKTDEDASEDRVTLEVLEQGDGRVRGNWIEARHGKLLLYDCKTGDRRWQIL